MGGEKGRGDGEATVEEKREEGEDRISAEAQYMCTYTHPSISLVPRPHPAFRRLQYGKAVEGLE